MGLTLVTIVRYKVRLIFILYPPIQVYVEFGAAAGDTIVITNTLATGTYNWNILARQISCTADWK